MATTIKGRSGNDTITGTSGSDKLIGGAGNDLLDGGAGSDFINAGSGNDTIVYDEKDYKILGGCGIDTLWFTGTAQSLNLGTHAVSGIEQLWLAGSGSHRVTLTAADITRVSDTDQMTIVGNETNRINPGLGWNFAGLTADGQSQILVNGLAKLTVSLPIFVEGFSGNANIMIGGLTTQREDSVPLDSPLVLSGKLLITDPNAGQGLLLGGPVAINDPKGNLQLSLDPASTGGTTTSYNYVYQTANADVQSLGEGKMLIDSFSVTTIDGSTKRLDFITTGVNDAAVIGDPTNSSLTEDINVGDEGTLIASGRLSIQDIDDGEAIFSTSVTPSTGNLGALALSSDGSYVYSVLNSNVQYLGEGQEKIDSFTIQSIDGTTKTISFTITGTNDLVTIGDATITNVTEDLNVKDGYLSVAGTIPITDVDKDDVISVSVNSSPETLGSLNLTGDGSYVYTVRNEDVQYLKSGEHKVDTFTISSADGVSKEISFTIDGANDMAIIGNPSAGSVTEDSGLVGQNLVAQGTISITDPDHGDAGFSTTVLPVGSTLGTLTLLQNGSYTYAVSNASVQYLNTGQSKAEIFTITATDGTTKNVSFTINGVSDEILGTSGNDTLLGLDGNDIIRGLDGNDSIRGLGGNDYIDGGLGSDTMIGGSGDDTYVVDAPGDIITELPFEGIDKVQSFISYTLSENVENLELLGSTDIDGTGNALANKILGNSARNIITAGEGNDFIDGLGGNDLVFGGDGNDTITCGIAQQGLVYGQSGKDTFLISRPQNFLEIYGGSGTDTFKFTSDFDSSDSRAVIGDFQPVGPSGTIGDILLLRGNPSQYSMRASFQFPASSELIDQDGDTVVTLGGIPFYTELMTTLLNQGNFNFY